MKSTILAAAIAATFAGMAGTASAETYGDVARVVSSTPIYETVAVPRRECHAEQVTAYEERRSVRPAPEGYAPVRNEGIGPGTVLGAIIGGVIGHQLGSSTAGRDHGAAAGAVIGGLIGHDAETRAADGYGPVARDEVIVERTPVTREVQRCNDVTDTSERIVGYDVRYEYNGREFRTRMPYDPGQEMPVNVDVRPPAAAHVPIAGPVTPSYRGPY
ncbi:MAG TPA: glycine zipper 2TM domain-containing protein [Usitatibacter sp.]|nr:glycine zipper 2TM domain-containing protein [Usitatibacter sp.]